MRCALSVCCMLLLTPTKQVGKSVFDAAPRNMREQLWMSSLQRKGIGVAASQKYEDMCLSVSLVCLGCVSRV